MGCVNGVEIRTAGPEDHGNIISVMPEWWGGRDLTASVPKLFLRHFGNTSFVAEKEGQLCGFLIGFLSQSQPEQGYIHFAGVHPELRQSGVARQLYQAFYRVCREDSRSLVKSCTSPVNVLSVGFHRAMGFSLEPGDEIMDGLPVTRGYLKEGEPLVIFKKVLAGT